MIRCTEENLKRVVPISSSMTEVMRKLGYTTIAGGTHTHVSERVKSLGIDTSHMTGQGWNRGNTAGNRLSSRDVLVYNRNNGRREAAWRLRRALLESGVLYMCVSCEQSNEWFDSELVLEIDHINSNFVDNRKENLRFLCPNCHSQTTNTNTI